MKAPRWLELKPLSPEGRGDKVLVLLRPGPFGTGVVSFLVDRVQDLVDVTEEVVAREAYVGDDFVVRFPPSFDYMLVSRDQVKFPEESDPEPVPEIEGDSSGSSGTYL